MWSHGSFYWNELMTRDVERAKTFYAEAIGWTFEGMPHETGTYWVAKLADRPVGGIIEMKGPAFEGLPESWMSYLAVDDVDARTRKATAAGGMVLRAPFDVPNVGRIVILREPGGAAIGWITPAPM
jgi:predicted enzyme related to lactoylglutathione lyase